MSTDVNAGSTPETAIPVKSVSDEYKYLQRQQCPQCGGLGYKLRRQALLQTEAGPRDMLETECITCSVSRTFYFDVTEVFVGYKRMFETT